MTDLELHKRVANNIRKFRKYKSLTQGELAESIGLTQAAVVRIENCKQWPSKATFTKLSNFFNVDIHHFFLPDKYFTVHVTEAELQNFLFENLKEVLADIYSDIKNRKHVL